jgi:hypothetical protein
MFDQSLRMASWTIALWVGMGGDLEFFNPRPRISQLMFETLHAKSGAMGEITQNLHPSPPQSRSSPTPGRPAWWCNFRELPVRHAVGEAVAPYCGGSGDPIFDFCQPSAKADAA